MSHTNFTRKLTPFSPPEPSTKLTKESENRASGLLNRVVSQLRDWEQAALDRSQDQTIKTDEQAYHLGKKDAYEAARLAVERENLANEKGQR